MLGKTRNQKISVFSALNYQTLQKCATKIVHILLPANICVEFLEAPVNSGKDAEINPPVFSNFAKMRMLGKGIFVSVFQDEPTFCFK